MNDADENLPKQKLLWPWFAAVLLLLGIAMAIGFMFFAVKKVESERDFSAPLPNSAPVR